MRFGDPLLKALLAALLLPACAFAQFEAAGPLPRTLMSHSAVTLGGRIYVAGGLSDNYSGTGFLNSVYYCASVNPDGTLGAWQSASPMPEFLGLGMHASLVHNNRIYVLGGSNYAGQRSRVYVSGVNTDGTLAGWQPVTALPNMVAAHSAAVFGDRLYVTGGVERGSGATASVYSVPVNPDGSLGAWRRELSMPAPVFGHRSFARGGRLFAVGGFNAPALYGAGGAPPSGVSSAVYAAAINPDGTLGAWTLQPPLPSGLAFYGLAVGEKSVYLMGGFDGGVTNAVYFAPFTASGTLGAWQPLHALPQNLVAPAAAASGEFIYSIGGGRAYLDDPVTDIYFARTKSELKAFVKLSPSAINKDSNGKWVTVVLGLPEAEAAAVLPDSVRIAAVNGQAVTPIAPDPKWTGKLYTGDAEGLDGLEGVTYLMLKFSRQAVADVIGEGEFSLKITGRLSDGREFSGESMNRALSSRKVFAARLEKREGERTGPGGVKVRIPKGAFKGNPELLLTAAPEDAVAVGTAEKEKRSSKLAARGLKAASETFEFGPHGETFDAPVTISLPYDPAALPAGTDEEALQVAYWNAAAGDWEPLPSTVSRADRTVSAETSHFSVYQAVLGAAPAAAPPAAAFTVGEAYVFPNPAVGGARPVLRVAASGGEKLQVKVYSASGRLAHEGSLSGAPGAGGAYELTLGGEFPSGVYYYLAEISAGAQKVKKTGKFAVVR